MAEYRFIGDPNDRFSGPAALDWFGLAFTRESWTTVPAELLGKIAGHTHFEAKPEKAKDAPQAPSAAKAPMPSPPEDKAFLGGAKARADGKKRNVPPNYRKKPEEARWLAGYDGEA